MCVCVYKYTYQLLPNIIPAAPPHSCFLHVLFVQFDPIKLKRETWVLCSFSPLGCSFHCQQQPSLPWMEVDADGRVKRQKHLLMMFLVSAILRCCAAFRFPVIRDNTFHYYLVILS